MPKKKTDTRRSIPRNNLRQISAWIEYARYYADLGEAVPEVAGMSGIVLLLKEAGAERYFHSLWSEESVRALTSKQTALSDEEMQDFAFQLSTRKSPVTVEVAPEDEVPAAILAATSAQSAATPTQTPTTAAPTPATPSKPATPAGKKPAPHFKPGKKNR